MNNTYILRVELHEVHRHEAAEGPELARDWKGDAIGLLDAG